MSESQHSPSGLENRLIEIAVIVVLVVVGFLAFRTYLLRTMFPRATSSVNACINNLRQIDGAVQQWALETKASATTKVVASDILPYLKSAVVCPAGGTLFSDSYTIDDVATKPTCQKNTADATLLHILPTDTAS